ncbi:MAG: radical SAM protein [Parvularculaceae bacterium]
MADLLPARTAPGKFLRHDITADGSPRAVVRFKRLETLWLNTGTLCNIECANCYIDSSPTNDQLVYLTVRDARPFLAEAAGLGAEEIGLTGGEPFMNPEIIDLAEECLRAGFTVLILTNAMRPMMRPRLQRGLAELRSIYSDRIALRVSLDHYEERLHDEERGSGGFIETLMGLAWLVREGFNVSVAGRKRWGEAEGATREGYRRLFAENSLAIDAADLARLVLFPEMDARADTPEITTACWDILKKSPDSVMCATSRMVVKRKGETSPVVLACTLIPYERAFELGASLAQSLGPVALNHPHCSKFCVLGGASCSPHA